MGEKIFTRLSHLDTYLEESACLVGRRVPSLVGQVGLAVDGVGTKGGLVYFLHVSIV